MPSSVYIGPIYPFLIYALSRGGRGGGGIRSIIHTFVILFTSLGHFTEAASLVLNVGVINLRSFDLSFFSLNGYSLNGYLLNGYLIKQGQRENLRLDSPAQ